MTSITKITNYSIIQDNFIEENAHIKLVKLGKKWEGDEKVNAGGS
jgi:hypothetical protein